MKLNLEEPKVSNWIKLIRDSGCTINDINALSIQTKQNGEILFAYLSADITSPEGYKLLPIIFLRGDAVIVVPEIVNHQTGEKKFLMVEQRRIASGQIHLEFPAGMLDRDVLNPAAIAIKELFEETGLQLDTNHLYSLSREPLFTSPGASDERIWIFGTSVELSDSEFKSLEGRVTGSRDENEHITTKLVERNEFIQRNNSTQALLALMLFESKNN